MAVPRSARRRRVARKLLVDMGYFASGALHKVEALFDVRDDVAFSEKIKRSILEFRHGRRQGLTRSGSRPRILVAPKPIIGIVLRQLKTARQQSLRNGMLRLFRHEDKVGIIRGDEEDGDSGQRERRRQLHDSARGIHAGAYDGDDEVVVGGDGNGFRGGFRKAFYGGLDDVLGPGAVADDGALEGGHADVEEAMLVVGG